MENIADKYISNIIDIQDDVIRRYENNIEIMNEAEQEKQDLLHEIELSTFDACKGYRLAKSLQENRIRRRIAKDENELLDEFYGFCKNQNINKNQLNNMLGKSRKVYDTHCRRFYRPRIREDLTITTAEPKTTQFGELLKDFKKDQNNKKKHKFA
jgi:hypothetical protein